MKKGIIARGIVAAACVIGVGIATVGCQAKPTGNVESETATTVVETEAAEESTVAEETTLVATQETVEAPEAQAERPEYYQTYANLLRQFRNRDHAYFSDILEAYEFDEESMQFALLDINGDGREELIVGNLDRSPNYNLLVPADNWYDAERGAFWYYDPQTGQIATTEGGVDETWEYCILDGDELTPVDEYTSSLNENDVADWNDYYHGNEPITYEEFYNQPAFQWPEFTADWHQITEQNIETILGDGTGSENSALKVLALDERDEGLVLTYQIGDTVKTQTSDYNAGDDFGYWGFDHLEGDLTGDGIDEVLINKYYPNNFIEGACVTDIYTLSGDTLVEMPCVLEDYFENSVFVEGWDGMKIENGNLYVSGAFKAEGVGFEEKRCLTYANGTWTEQYRQQFPDMEEPYGDRYFNDGAEAVATFKNDCETQPERMQTIYPGIYSMYQNGELESWLNNY